jgi:hypothetical protein
MAEITSLFIEFYLLGEPPAQVDGSLNIKERGLRPTAIEYQK